MERNRNHKTLVPDTTCVTLETTKGSPSRNETSENLFLFHKTSHSINPSVTDYETLKARMAQLTQSPKAIIGNAPRFIKNKLKDYVSKTAHQYVERHSILAKKPAAYGTFFNQKRWTEMNDKERRPGVGEYDLTRFKCLSKANETNFECPQYNTIDSKMGVKQLSKHRRVMSAAP